jgi:SAM-dependent methyltransferase
VEDLSLPPGAFDNITLFHVLEHVPDPAMLIDLCRDLLRSKGVLVIAVPNDVLAWSSTIKKAGKRLRLKPFQKFSPVLGIPRAGSSREIHLSHFTPAVLRKLVEQSGLDVVEESLDPYYVSSGVRRIVVSAYYALHQMLHAAFKSNRYETIWMVAQKP